jgi:hypothetical protein
MGEIPGETVNMYYYSSKTVKKSKVQTYQTTNAIYNLNSLSSGSTSTVIIPSNAGLSHFVLSVRLPSALEFPGLTYNGLSLPANWLASFVENISYRYAGSDQWYVSGDSLRICSAVNAGNAMEKQNLISLGGATLYKKTDFSGPNLYASIPLSLAHVSSESGSETPCPLDSSLLNGSPIQLTITWKDFSKVFGQAGTPDINGGGAPSTIPPQFKDAWVQVRQVIPLFRDDLLRLKGDEAYRYPIKFYQFENRTELTKNVGSQTVNLVGTKQGQCLGVYVWATKQNNGDLFPGSTGTTIQQVINANSSTYVPLKDLKISYAGTVLHDYRGPISGAIMDTLASDSPSYFQTSKIIPNLGGAGGSTGDGWVLQPNDPSAISYFTHFPFSSRVEQKTGSDGTYMITNGVGINNGSLELVLEIDETPSLNDKYTLHYMPYFSAALEFKDSVVRYVF